MRCNIDLLTKRTRKKKEAEDRARTEWMDKEDKDRIHFEKIFPMAIGGRMNMIKSGKRRERHNNKDDGGQKNKSSKVAIELSRNDSRVSSSEDGISDDELDEAGSAVFNLGQEF